MPRTFRHPDLAVPTGETNNARARGSNAHRPYLSRTHDKAQAYAIPHFTGQKIMMVLP